VVTSVPSMPEVERSWSGRLAVGKDLNGSHVSYVSVLSGPPPPAGLFTSIRNLEQLDRLPVVLAAFFALIAVIALANAAGTAVVRRRRDIAVLRAIGFTPRQSGRVLFGMMTTIAVVGVAVGVPFGLLVGRLLWRTVADGIHVGPNVSPPFAAMAIASVGAIVLANLVGIVPAALAARRTAATDLRAE
jgi:ABC-type antimicrobial peptide transport system permease subunit